MARILSEESKIKNRLRVKVWAKANPERVRENALRGYYRHHEKRKAIGREYMKHQRAINPEKCRKTFRSWREKNIDYCKERSLKWAHDNRERTRKNEIAYRKKNPHKIRVWAARSKASRKGAVGKYTAQQWFWKCSYYGWKCIHCNTRLSKETVTVEHIIPISAGGTNWASNIAPACFSCNVKRKNREYITKLRHRT